MPVLVCKNGHIASLNHDGDTCDKCGEQLELKETTYDQHKGEEFEHHTPT
jgi:hypothetical protein